MNHLLIATRNTHKLREIQAVLGEGFRFWTLRDLPAAPTVVEDAPTFAGNALKKAVNLAAWLTAATPEAVPAELTAADLCWVLADDSGLEVEALQGAPGVHSARFAALDQSGALNASDAANNARLLALLAVVPLPQRTARFRCVMALTPVNPFALPAAPGSVTPHFCSGVSSERRILPSHNQRRPDESPLQTDPQDFEPLTRLFDGVCEGVIGFEPRGENGFGYDPMFIPQGHQATFAELGDAIKNQISHRARALAQLKRQVLGATTG